MADQRQIDFYTKLRQRIRDWADREDHQEYAWTRWLLLAPDLFHLLLRLAADPDVPVHEKAKVAMVIAYFISPLDLLPEMFLGPTGFLDDICLTAYALNGIVNRVDADLVRQHWAGEDDVLDIIHKILELGDRMLGSGLFKRIKRMIT